MVELGGVSVCVCGLRLRGLSAGLMAMSLGYKWG